MNSCPSLFHLFTEDISKISLPQEFTYPFHYTPHPLSVLAAQQLQHFLEQQAQWQHNFGLNPLSTHPVIGKMFGVLVVKNLQGQVGQLWAISGKLFGDNDQSLFVPSIGEDANYDQQYLLAKKQVAAINDEILKIEGQSNFKEFPIELKREEDSLRQQIADFKLQMKRDKEQRNILRENQKANLDENQYEHLCKELAELSIEQKISLKRMNELLSHTIETNSTSLQLFFHRYHELKNKRQEILSAIHQQKIKRYSFLNALHQRKDLYQIFDGEPPAGAGDCAAPKLLQYAFEHQLTPLAMAEFWWGVSPKAEIRNHTHFYPSCKGRCRPILDHMLEGMCVEKNPLLCNIGKNTTIEMIYEDQHFLVINKPSGLLSVPGSNIFDSVASRLKINYPDCIIVHRLDQCTSGIMLIAKNQQIHQILQKQFIKRTVQKRYLALLDGEIASDEGIIDLPLRVDLDNRPYQMVCYQFGKKATTLYKVLKKENGKTRVLFTPITGRTHQLRVHSAHRLGLNTPIVGDSLYGQAAARLHLHAQWIKIHHPITHQEMEFEAPCPF